MAADSVEGMHAEAVHEAAARARTRRGPSFLECRTYRFFGHHTAERTMKLGYRTDEEIATWRARDPLDVTGAKLDPRERARIDEEVEALLDDAVEFARRSPRPDVTTALDYMYADGMRPRTGVVA